jgi:hypothetical protein
MHRFQRIAVPLLAAGAFALWPAGVGASTTVAPTSLTFAAQPAGTTSAAKQVVLTKDCTGTDDTFCFADPGFTTFNTSIGVSGPFTQTNNCPAMLTATNMATSASCTINVKFAPTGEGAASGTLTTGIGGPTASLAGTGTSAIPAKKKCKKKKGRSADAAKKKKCKKKGKPKP